MFTSAVVSIVVRNTIFRKAPPSVVSGYGERSINLNKVVATFEGGSDFLENVLKYLKVHVHQ